MPPYSGQIKFSMALHPNTCNGNAAATTLWTVRPTGVHIYSYRESIKSSSSSKYWLRLFHRVLP